MLRLLYIPKILYRIHKTELLDPTLGQMNPVHALKSTYLRSILMLSSQVFHASYVYVVSENPSKSGALHDIS
jgi:hypothetical protein